MAGYIHPQVNITAWNFFEVIQIVWGVYIYLTRLWIWGKAWKVTEDSREAAIDKATAKTLHYQVQSEMKESMFEDMATHFLLTYQKKNWLHAQYEAMPEEVE